MSYKSLKQDFIDAVNHGMLPRHIYKYRCNNIFTLESIINSKVHFANANQFNDPFDSKANYDTEYTIEERMLYVKSIDDRYPGQFNDETLRINLIYDNDFFVKYILELLREMRENNIGISCFSKNNDNLLLWAHYSDSHKGLCFKYDVLQDVDFFLDMNVLKYSQEYDKKRLVDNNKILFDAIFTKSIDWKYEEEIRVFKEGKGLFPINREALVGIIFGARFPESSIETYQRIVEYQYHDIILEKATISIDQYKVDINPII